MTVSEITLASLTTGALDGTGVFDVLMRAAKVHLEDQFNQDRIRGPEYSTVYLGQLESSMATALQFLTAQKKITLEAQLLEQQVILAQIEVQKVNVQLAILEEQKLTAVVERTLMEAQVVKLNAEIELIPLQKLQLQAQTALIDQQKANALTENGLLVANTTRINAEAANIPKQGALIEAQTAMSVQQKANAVVEGTVLVAQECKLRAEYDYTLQSTLKAVAETNVMNQKLITERAQIMASGVDDNSVIGKQKRLYEAQAEGFTRDAEQKAAKLLTDTWSARRMSDDATVADGINMLNDATIGRAITKLLAGVGA